MIFMDWIGKNLVELVLYILKLIFKRRSNKKVRQADQSLKHVTESTVESIKSEPIFFDEPTEKKYFFYKGLIIKNSTNKSKRIRYKKLINKSYLIVGEAGCGKSALIKNDFLKINNQKLRCASIAQWFLNSNELRNILQDKSKQAERIEQIIQTKRPKLYLYIDGVDEIGEENINLFYDFIDMVSNKIGNGLILKITCRREFASRHVERQLSKYIKEYLEISNWNTRILLKYCKKLIYHLNLQKHKNHKYKREIYSVIKKSKMINNITSPLLMKLFIYCYMNGDKNIVMNTNIDNLFEFYSLFVNILLKSYSRKKYSPITDDDLNKQQDEFAEYVFIALKNSTKVLTMHVESIMPLCKEVFNNNFTLIHETFYEYFIARHYYNCIQSNHLNKNSICVYCGNYSNDYADFITAAFNKDRKSNRILQRKTRIGN